MIELHNWYFSGELGGLTIDKTRRLNIHGNVVNHPRIPDGYHIHSTAVVIICPLKRTVTTKSGSVYHLNNYDGDHFASEESFWKLSKRVNPEFNVEVVI